MSKKQNDEKPPESLLEIELKQRVDAESDPSPGFYVVVIGLLAYIFYVAKLVTFSLLHPVSIALVVVGFVMLLIEALGKVKFQKVFYAPAVF